MLFYAQLVILLIIANLFIHVTGSYSFANFKGNRTTIVHLFEWKWDDIAEECETFLGPMGYGGVQVSPIMENVIVQSRPWWERYQPMSYKWETRSGNEQAFRAMVARCNCAGVRIYVDILMNHMSANHNKAIGTAGSMANTWEMYYPGVPYQKCHFHDSCMVNNFSDPFNVRNCELVGLHDLDQSKQYVRDTLVKSLNKAVDAGVAGFRVDAAKHMWPKDLKMIYSRTHDLNVKFGFEPGTRPFFYQEVIDYGNEAISKYDYNKLGAVTEFRYGSEISNALLRRNPLKWFMSWGEAWGLLPSDDALVFIDNHDTQRNGGDVPITYKSPKLYKMAVAFMLAHPYGTPKVMSSFDFNNHDQGPPADAAGNILSPSHTHMHCGNGWVCEHRWRQIYNMVGFRNYVKDFALANWWDNGSYQIAFCRGNQGFLAINAETTDMRQRLKVCLPPGVYCDVISGEARNGACTGKTVWVNENGEADIVIDVNEPDGVLAIYAGVKIA